MCIILTDNKLFADLRCSGHIKPVPYTSENRCRHRMPPYLFARRCHSGHWRFSIEPHLTKSIQRGVPYIKRETFQIKTLQYITAFASSIHTHPQVMRKFHLALVYSLGHTVKEHILCEQTCGETAFIPHTLLSAYLQAEPVCIHTSPCQRIIGRDIYMVTRYLSMAILVYAHQAKPLFIKEIQGVSLYFHKSIE